MYDLVSSLGFACEYEYCRVTVVCSLPGGALTTTPNDILKRGTKVMFAIEETGNSWTKGKVSRVRSDGSVNIHSYGGERFANVPVKRIRIIGRKPKVSLNCEEEAVKTSGGERERETEREHHQHVRIADPREEIATGGKDKDIPVDKLANNDVPAEGCLAMRTTRVPRNIMKSESGNKLDNDNTRLNLQMAIAELESMQVAEPVNVQKPLDLATKNNRMPVPIESKTQGGIPQLKSESATMSLPEAALLVQRCFRGFLGRQVVGWIKDREMQELQELEELQELQELQEEREEQGYQPSAQLGGVPLASRSSMHNASIATQGNDLEGFDFLAQEEKFDTADDNGMLEPPSFPTPYNVLPKDGLPQLNDDMKIISQIKETNGLRCFALTYDIGDSVLDDIVNFAQDLFQPEQHHVYILGFQRDIMMGSPEEAWKDDKLLANFGPAYTLLKRQWNTSLYICVVVHKVLRPHVSLIESAEITIGSYDGEKMRSRATSLHFVAPPGAVAVSFKLLDKTYLYLNALLTGGHGKSVDRNANIKEIEHKLPLPRKNHNPTVLLKDRFDHVLWMGNLNYRIKGTRSTVMRLLDKVCFGDLRVSDQLSQAHTQGNIFVGYSEGPLNFLPTFKYDIGFQRFDTSSELVVPSWTDRILWTISEEIYLLAYDTDDEMTLTHHRPVWAVHHVMVGTGLYEAIENFTAEQLERQQQAREKPQQSQACRIS